MSYDFAELNKRIDQIEKRLDNLAGCFNSKNREDELVRISVERLEMLYRKALWVDRYIQQLNTTSKNIGSCSVHMWRHNDIVSISTTKASLEKDELDKKGTYNEL